MALVNSELINTTFTGSTVPRTYTLPDADATLLTTNAVVTPAQGGTGVANNAASTITISGNFALTLTLSGTTGVTLPTSGTLMTTAGSGTAITFPGLLSIAAAKTLTASNTLTLTGTDSSSVAFGAGGTVAYIGAANAWSDGVKQTFNPDATNAGINVGAIAGDPSAPANGDLWYDSTANELTARINGVSVALGAGSLTVGTTVINSGTTTRILYDNAGALGEYTLTGTGTVVAMQTSPSLVTPALGVATATSVNGLTITTSTGTLTIPNGVTLTGPAASGTAATLGNAETFTANKIFTTTVTTGTGATAGVQITADSLTTGNGVDISSSSVTSGNVVSIAATGTVAASDTKTALRVSTSGANGTSGETTFGGNFTNTSTGTSSLNIGIFASASGGAGNLDAKFGNGADASALASPSMYLTRDGTTIIAVRDSTNDVEGYLLSFSGGVQVGAHGAFSTSIMTSNLARITVSSAGAIRFVTGYGAGTITSDASGNLTSVSDERQKHVRGFFTRGLESLKEIQPIFYKWTKESGMETEHVYAGMSAQNVQLGIPEAVSANNEGWLGLNDRAVIAVLINACNQLAEKVELLEARG